jgi:CRP-like cAMP-binding protein
VSPGWSSLTEVVVVQKLGVGSRLIETLPESERAALLEGSTPISLEVGQILADAGQPMTHAYFPMSGVLSLVTVLEDGSMIEAATVGNEGLVGMSLVLGGSESTSVRAMCQVKGDAYRMPAAVLVRLFEELPTFRSMLLRYAHALFVQAAQSAACNRLHPAEARAAKWLLLCDDRVEGNRFHLTQEFLAQMLGVRRASITEVANHLRDNGLIDYRRGDITILDRPGLEGMSCGCYVQIRTEYDSYLAHANGTVHRID